MQTPGSKAIWLSVAAAVLAMSAPAMAGDGVSESTAYGVALFGPGDACGDWDMTHSTHYDTADAFTLQFDMLASAGLWDSTKIAYDTAVRATQWTDASQAPPCSGCTAADTATKGVDSADVVFIHTHGGNDSNGSWLWMGSETYGCYADTANQMLLGNTDLNVAVIKACDSADYDVFTSGAYDQMASPSGEFTVWNGFHGISSCSSAVTSYVTTYTAGSLYDGVGENWLDEAYNPSPLPMEDDCPVSIVFGATASERSDMYHWGGWKDLKNTGNKTGSTYFYWKGCWPTGGNQLPT